ncbi:hypothetical protein CAPTEDRAFT_223257 [Capitella teleta]|uniref:Ciliary microtubule inner protein 2A-C-like domain-containing protein n=1 Tax=Capitella teleta TaxID=283909 RepID=R7UVG8_CAPTE|nr:hypothetical protein CAPTEDRAFT_223257 [Capitella teleta]|eukprot:ELU07391.1 hypothetical protein CAPTEDRAFT_223257 [Capitella teleta]
MDAARNSLASPKVQSTSAKSDCDFLQRRIKPSSGQSTDRHHISGYAGFVPRYREFVGAGFPHVTSSALKEFEAEQSRMSSSRGSIPRTVDLSQTNPNPTPREPIKKTLNTFPIFVEKQGLTPNYSGHIPGEKFRFGGTFGQTTMSAASASQQKKS